MPFPMMGCGSGKLAPSSGRGWIDVRKVFANDKFVTEQVNVLIERN